MFIASDVAKALGYKKPENAIARHCKRRGTTPKQGGGFLTVIPESDLYRLTFRSKLAAAEEFTDWVVEEVLPSIRKNGKYEIPRETLSPEQQRHIQETVSMIFVRDGIHYSTSYKNIKTKFQVGTYKDIKQEHYSSLCSFLGVQPIGDNADSELITVNKQNLKAMTSLVKMQRDNFDFVIDAQEKAEVAIDTMKAAVIIAEQGLKSISYARYKMNDPVMDANFCAGLLRG
jgi:hypothetical protein